MRRSSEGGYDAWGVRWPGGVVREFNSEDSAVKFQERMEGQEVILADGTTTIWSGLMLVHRFIPEWTEIDQSTDPPEGWEGS